MQSPTLSKLTECVDVACGPRVLGDGRHIVKVFDAEDGVADGVAHGRVQQGSVGIDAAL